MKEYPIVVSGICNPQPLPVPQNKEIRFTPVVGSLIRGAFRNHLETLAFRLCLNIDIQENKGLLDSTFMVRVSGPTDTVNLFENAFNEYRSRIE